MLIYTEDCASHGTHLVEQQFVKYVIFTMEYNLTYSFLKYNYIIRKRGGGVKSAFVMGQVQDYIYHLELVKDHNTIKKMMFLEI